MDKFIKLLYISLTREMVTLGQQISEKRKQQSTGRATRTERVAYQQQTKKAQQTYASEKAIADVIAEKLWKDVEYQDQETTKTYRPSNMSAREWDRMSQSSRDRIMQPFYNNQFYGVEKQVKMGNLVVHSTGTKTVTKTRPFTNEDYGNVVENLSPEIKKFFVSKEQLVQQQTDWRGEQTTKTQTAIATAQQSLANYTASKKQQMREYEDWFKRLSQKERDSRKQHYNEKMQKYEDDLEEKQAYYQGVIEKLNWGTSQLKSGNMYSYEDIESSAIEFGHYKESYEDARNENRIFNEKQMLAGLTPIYKTTGNKTISGWITSEQKKELPKYITDKGMTVTSTYGRGYSEAQFNAFSSAQKYAEKVGFEKLPPSQQAILNPSAVEWQEQNPTEVLKFDKYGGVVGVVSGLMGGKEVSIEQYNDKKTWQDYNYQNWETTEKKITFPFKVIEGNANYYTGQTMQMDGSGNVVYPSIIVPESQYYSQKDAPKIDLTFGTWGKVIQGYDWVKDRVHWNVELSGSPSMPKLSIISFGKNYEYQGSATGDDLKLDYYKETPTNVEVWSQKGLAGLDKASKSVDAWVIGQEKIDTFKSDIDTKYQEEYQSRFENKYMKDLIYEEITFDEASSLFGESEDAKIVQKRYAEEYGKGYKELQTFTIKDDGFWKTARADVVGGVAQMGISLASMGIKVTDNPLDLATTGVGIYTGTKALSLIPPTVNYGILGVSTVYGGYKFFNPSSTYLEAGAGLTTAVISGYFLGRAGLKYLKSPVVTRKDIPAPKRTLTTDAIGREKNSFLVKLHENTKKMEEVYYGKQKLGQYGFAGSRAEVTTKWRDLFNKYVAPLDKRLVVENVGGSGWNSVFRFDIKPSITNLDPIYYGVPTQQLGTTWAIEGLRGTTDVKITQSAYQNAKDLLVKYGYTPSQATGTLRYYAPTYIEQYLESGKILVSGNQAMGSFRYLTTQPVLDVDDILGIKTRGAKTVRNTYNFGREIVGTTKAGDFLVLESGEKVSAFVTKQGASYNLLSQAGKTKTFYTQLSAIKSSDISEALIPTKYKDVYAIKNYQILDSVYSKKQLIPLIREMEMGKSSSYLLKNTPQGELPVWDFDKIIKAETGFSVSRASSNWVKPANIKKTPFTFTFEKTGDTNQLKKLIKEIAIDNQVAVTTPTNIEKEFFSSGQSPQSQYYGMGLYERTSDAGLFNIGNVQGGQALKFMNAPQIQTPPMFNQGAIPTLKLDTLLSGELLSVGVLSSLKSNMKMDNMLKMDLKFDLGLKQELGLKNEIKQMTSLKQTSAQKSALKSILTTSPVVSNAFTVPNIMETPPITPRPPIIPLIIGIGERQEKKKGRGKRKITPEMMGLFPDFTSRAIGLAPTKVSGVEGALREIRKLQTGFEIRKGARIDANFFGKAKKGKRGKRGMSDKQLMRSVMA